MLDRVGELAATPVLDAMHLAAVCLDQRFVALDHGWHLLALVRMDQEHDFIMTHGISSRVSPQSMPRRAASRPETGGEARVFDRTNRRRKRRDCKGDAAAKQPSRATDECWAPNEALRCGRALRHPSPVAVAPSSS